MSKGTVDGSLDAIPSWTARWTVYCILTRISFKEPLVSTPPTAKYSFMQDEFVGQALGSSSSANAAVKVSSRMREAGVASGMKGSEDEEENESNLWRLRF